MRIRTLHAMRYLGGVVVFVVLASVAVPLLAPADPTPAHRPELRSEQDCGAAGGIWSRAGLRGIAHCVRQTLDAGRACQGHGDCETLCVTDDNTPPGAAVTGRCFEWTQTVGHCYNRVRDGVAVGLVCKD